MKLVLGPETVKIYIGFYAKTGRWPALFIQQLRGVEIPAEMLTRANLARDEELRKQAIRDTRPSGLLEEEEVELGRLEQVIEKIHKEAKPWEPNVEGLCPHCGNRHPAGEMRCGTAGNA